MNTIEHHDARLALFDLLGRSHERWADIARRFRGDRYLEEWMNVVFDRLLVFAPDGAPEYVETRLPFDPVRATRPTGPVHFLMFTAALVVQVEADMGTETIDARAFRRSTLVGLRLLDLVDDDGEWPSRISLELDYKDHDPITVGDDGAEHAASRYAPSERLARFYPALLADLGSARLPIATDRGATTSGHG